jgi:hypothetical protein
MQMRTEGNQGNEAKDQPNEHRDLPRDGSPVGELPRSPARRPMPPPSALCYVRSIMFNCMDWASAGWRDVARGGNRFSGFQARGKALKRLLGAFRRPACLLWALQAPSQRITNTCVKGSFNLPRKEWRLDNTPKRDVRQTCLIPCSASHCAMKTKKVLLLVVSAGLLVLVSVGLVSAFVGYQYGYSWGRRAEQRSALRLPGTVDVYGCGVDKFIRIEPSRVVHVYEFLAGLQPLPAAANAAFIDTGQGNQYCTLTELLSTNGMGNRVLAGGERVLLVHAFK